MLVRAIFLTAALGCALLAQAPAVRGKIYTPARTADGQPDLQGIWNNATITPLERPAEMADKAFFTPAEAAAYEKAFSSDQNNRDRRDGGGAVDVARAYNQSWFDRGTRVVASLRTSLITSGDGRIHYTSDARDRLSTAAAYARQHPADGPEDLSLTDRCLLWYTAGPPMLPGPYNSNYQILQTPGYVTIVSEMIHDVRVIPLDGRPHTPPEVRLWMGDSRGHWEGNTLVVDTTNFSSQTRFHGATEKMHVTERFTRTGPDAIRYEFTVEDPATFAQPWSGEIPLNRAQGPIYEYACHEGNYGMAGILSGARAQEKSAK